MSDKQLQLGADDAFLALERAWKKTIDVLEDHINKPSFENWIKTIRLISIDDTVVRLGTNSQFAKHWLESKYMSLIKDILQTNLGFNITIYMELVSEDEPDIMKKVGALPTKPAHSPKSKEENISLPLNNNYNFETFVVGPTNRLAHACALAVSETPGRTYNPLFVYGGPGLGKTHLMHAIGHSVSEINPGTKILYVSGEAFTYHYINSLREHRTENFRRQYRNVDLWLIDDIQFLIGKERTEEEFFHTYNALYEMGKQIVLTSDRAPKDLQLDKRLLSRFECGMLTDIRPPDLETRMAILQAKADSEHLVLPNEVILYIARLITSNIRQLEGALIKLHAYASLMKTSVTPSLAEEVLGNYFTEHAPPAVDAQKVQEAVAKRFNVNVTDLQGTSRSKDIVAPRQIAMYLMRDLTESSLPVIGKAFGGKDHSTVMHSCKKVEEKLSKDKNFALVIEELSRQIRDGKTC